MTATKNKAIFIDKDGTLIPDIPYNVNPAVISIEEEVIQGLQILQKEGYLFIVISNQSGVARGYFEMKDLQQVEQKIAHLLSSYNIDINGFYFCPHHIEGTVPEYTVDCNCRKPRPGMLLQACEDHHIDPSTSWMIGDILNDVEAGNRAGCKTVLIDNGNETEWVKGEYRTPLYLAPNFMKAAQFIVNHKEAEEAA